MKIEGGEKAFTDKARDRMVRAFMAKRAVALREAKRLEKLAVDLQVVDSLAGLRKIFYRTTTDDPSLRDYCNDSRKVCTHCKRKASGGIYGAILGDRQAYYCWREACRKAGSRALAKDKKTNAALYAAERARVRVRRLRAGRRWSPGRRRRL